MSEEEFVSVSIKRIGDLTAELADAKMQIITMEYTREEMESETKRLQVENEILKEQFSLHTKMIVTHINEIKKCDSKNKRLQAEIEAVKTHHRFDLSQFRKCQDETKRLREALEEIARNIGEYSAKAKAQNALKTIFSAPGKTKDPNGSL